LIAKVNYFLVCFVESFYVLQTKYCFNTVMPSQDSSEKLFEVSLHFFLLKNSDQASPPAPLQRRGGKGSFLGLEKSKRDEKTCNG
jgi:hypothetical protein